MLKIKEFDISSAHTECPIVNTSQWSADMRLPAGLWAGSGVGRLVEGGLWFAVFASFWAAYI